jgi:hypothetical protein
VDASTCSSAIADAIDSLQLSLRQETRVQHLQIHAWMAAEPAIRALLFFLADHGPESIGLDAPHYDIVRMACNNNSALPHGQANDNAIWILRHPLMHWLIEIHPDKFPADTFERLNPGFKFDEAGNPIFLTDGRPSMVTDGYSEESYGSLLRAQVKARIIALRLLLEKVVEAQKMKSLAEFSGARHAADSAVAASSLILRLLSTKSPTPDCLEAAASNIESLWKNLPDWSVAIKKVADKITALRVGGQFDWYVPGGCAHLVALELANRVATTSILEFSCCTLSKENGRSRVAIDRRVFKREWKRISSKVRAMTFPTNFEALAAGLAWEETTARAKIDRLRDGTIAQAATPVVVQIVDKGNSGDKDVSDIVMMIRRAFAQNPDLVDQKTALVLATVGGARNDVLAALRVLRETGEYRGHQRQTRRREAET